MDFAINLPDTSSFFSENMRHPEPIKIAIIKKCPKLLRIYGRFTLTMGQREGECLSDQLSSHLSHQVNKAASGANYLPLLVLHNNSWFTQKEIITFQELGGESMFALTMGQGEGVNFEVMTEAELRAVHKSVNRGHYVSLCQPRHTHHHTLKITIDIFK